MAATGLRILKNPLQYEANKQLQFRDAPQKWAELFSSTCTVYNIRIYTLIDFLVYFVWIFGTFGTSQGSFTDNEYSNSNNRKNDSVLVIIAQYEILLSSLSYVTCIIVYATSFLLHRSSMGRCLPGYIFDNR